MGFSAFQRNFLLFAFAGFALTGMAWAWSDVAHGLGPVDDEAVQAARAWLGRAHGAFAMLGLLAFGAAAATHVPRSWDAGSRRVSGIALAAIFLVLTVTGYLLYYASGDFLRVTIVYAHIAAGVAAIAAFALHWLRRTASKRALDS
jgi:hypothetical protein